MFEGRRLAHSPYLLRIILVLGGTLLVATALARWLLLPALTGAPLPAWEAVTAGVLDAVFVSTAAALALLLLSRLVEPPEPDDGMLSIVDPNQADDRLIALAQGVDAYWYKGHIGRYPRRDQMPRLIESARKAFMMLDVHIIILDPDDAEVCRAYAAHQRSNNKTDVSAGGRPWTEEHVRHQLLATIVAFHCWRHEYDRLRLHISLLRDLTLPRVDLSPNGALLTKDNAVEPMQYYPPGSPFYRSYAEEVKLAEDLARERGRIDESPVAGPSRKDLTPADVKVVLADIGIIAPVDDATAKAVHEILRKEKTAYPRKLLIHKIGNAAVMRTFVPQR